MKNIVMHNSVVNIPETLVEIQWTVHDKRPAIFIQGGDTRPWGYFPLFCIQCVTNVAAIIGTALKLYRSGAKMQVCRCIERLHACNAISYSRTHMQVYLLYTRLMLLAPGCTEIAVAGEKRGDLNIHSRFSKLSC